MRRRPRPMRPIALVIEQVLRRLREAGDLEDTDVNDDSDYEPSTGSTCESNGSEAAPVIERVVFRKADEPGDCAICLEEMRWRQHGGLLPCGHRYHRRCIEAWFERGQPRCPTCRAGVTADA